MKLPEHAQKVFEGVHSDVYHWEQQMYDNTTTTFEVVRRQHSTAVIAFVEDAIILLEQEQPNKPTYYSLPGGMIEKNQTPQENARAELLEESGYVSDNWKELGYYQTPSTRIDYRCYVYLARDCKKVAEQTLDGGEKIRVELISYERFVELLSSRQLQEGQVLKQIIQNELSESAKERLKKLLFD